MTHRLRKGESKLFPISVWTEGDNEEADYAPADATHDITVTSSNPELLPASVVQKGDEKFVRVTNVAADDAPGVSVTVQHGAHYHVMSFDLGDPRPGTLMVDREAGEDAPEHDPDEPAKDYPAPQA